MTNTTTVGAVWNHLTERERAGNDSAPIDERYAPSRFPPTAIPTVFRLPHTLVALATRSVAVRDFLATCARRGRPMADGATGDTGAPRANRRAIGIVCALHRGPRGFANLVVEKQGGEIVFDMHVTAPA
ncbi:MAG: hypothetical protein ACRDRQ_17590 [Pseudonocardiaceae bacterium]